MLPGGASEIIMMMSSSGNIFLVTGPLWGESIGHRWIPLTKASDAELWCFFELRLKKGWANNRDDDDLGPNRVHYNVPVMIIERPFWLHKHQPKTFGMQHICNLVFFFLNLPFTSTTQPFCTRCRCRFGYTTHQGIDILPTDESVFIGNDIHSEEIIHIRMMGHGNHDACIQVWMHIWSLIIIGRF